MRFDEFRFIREGPSGSEKGGSRDVPVIMPYCTSLWGKVVCYGFSTVMMSADNLNIMNDQAIISLDLFLS